MAKQVAVDDSDDFFRDIGKDYTPISENFGEKITWAEGVGFKGTYLGSKIVPMDDGSEAESAEFEDTEGKKFYSWMPYQLKQVINDGKLKPGMTVAILCTGEVPTNKGLNPVKMLDIRVKP